MQEALLIGDALRNLLHTARFKNKLFIKHEKIQGMKTLEAISKKINDQSITNADFKPDRNVVTQPTMETTAQTGKNLSKGVASGLDQAQALIVKLDNEQITGLFNDLIWQPAKNSDNEAKKLTTEVKKQIEKIVENYSKKEF